MKNLKQPGSEPFVPVRQGRSEADFGLVCTAAAGSFPSLITSHTKLQRVSTRRP